MLALVKCVLQNIKYLTYCLIYAIIIFSNSQKGDISMKQTKSAVVHTVFVAIFLAIGAVAFLGLIIFDIEMLSLLPLPPAEGSEGLSQGLGLAVAAVLVIICAFATAIVSAIGIIISAVAVKVRFGGAKLFSVIALIFEIIFTVISVTSVIFVAVGL